MNPPLSRPPKLVCPADHSDGYDDYFDASMASRLLPPVPPSRLYDTIARAHNHRSQPDSADPSWSTPRPLLRSPRRTSFSKAMKNPPPSPHSRPRRSSYEARRGAVGVTPSKVNTLVPYIPPIDTTMPPPSKEWLDAAAKRILAATHVDAEPRPADPPPDDDDDDWNFDKDSDSDLDPAPAPQPAPPPPQPEPESSSESDHPWSDTDTDSDMDSDDGYNWSTTRISESSPLALSDVPRWIIPRKRPSVDVIHTNKPPDASKGPTPRSSDDDHSGKRPRGGGKWTPSKQPKLHPQDTPTRQHRVSVPPPDSDQPASSASDAATSHLPVSSHSPQPNDVPCSTMSILDLHSNIASRTPKTFLCQLDGCTQVCASAGDLQRHQQSLRHRAPSYPCLACHKSYTRLDALKRHLSSKVTCRKDHATKFALAHGGVET